ncbi:hypothetical protein CLV68_2960 [Actinokineospora cianjurensis]|uniref:Uncharacterized protein n=1 Tax=Actinokineospora cianjurensis TaxID=585224 RepID=A0A421B2G7_9PSEU|nr:hypothetical protein CLV68_2960 [Actinokineospora cianjurensis]
MADAAPPPRAEVAVLGSSPITGAGLVIDLEGALDLGGQGVSAATIGGSGHIDDDVNFKVAKGSTISYDRQIRSGRALLLGGLRLAKGTETLLVSGMSADLKSGVITAKVGLRPGIRLGTITAPATARATKPVGSTTITLDLATSGVTLDPAFAAAIDDTLGTALPTNPVPRTTLTIDIDLIRGHSPNPDLLTALGLDSSLDLADLLAFRLDTTVDLGSS